MNADFLIGETIYEGQCALITKGYAKSCSSRDLGEQKEFIIKRAEIGSRFSRSCQNERKILENLKNFPQYFNQFVYYFQTSRHENFVHESYNQGTLESLINNPKIDFETIIDYFSQIVVAFQILNEKKIIHLDLRPSSIFIHDGHIKIGGFYSSTMENSPETIHYTEVLASPLYASPELLCGKPLTQKTDVWSLGVILYELLYQKYPWQEKKIFKTKQEYLDNIDEGLTLMKLFPSSFFASSRKYPEEIEELILSMLNENETERISFEEISKSSFFSGRIHHNKLQKRISCQYPSEENKTLLVEQKVFKIPGNIKYKEENTILIAPNSFQVPVIKNKEDDFTNYKRPLSRKIESISENNREMNRLGEVNSDYACLIEKMIQKFDLRYIPFKSIEKKEIIKNGGQANVFSAIYNKQRYALKEISNVDLELFEKVLQEACNLKNYENPRLIKLYGVSYIKCPYGENSINLFLITDYKEGDLEDAILKKKMSLETKIKIAFQIALGIHHLHVQPNNLPPLIHSDLKPSNIVIDNLNKAYLIDLGISRQIYESQIASSNSYTPGYCAPEHFFFQKITTASDIWSLGFLYLYLFFGVRAHLGIYQEIKESYDQTIKIKQEVEELKEIKILLEKMIKFDPKKRINIQGVIKELEIISVQKKIDLKECYM